MLIQTRIKNIVRRTVVDSCCECKNKWNMKQTRTCLNVVVFPDTFHLNENKLTKFNTTQVNCLKVSSSQTFRTWQHTMSKQSKRQKNFEANRWRVCQSIVKRPSKHVWKNKRLSLRRTTRWIHKPFRRASCVPIFNVWNVFDGMNFETSKRAKVSGACTCLFLCNVWNVFEQNEIDTLKRMYTSDTEVLNSFQRFKSVKNDDTETSKRACLSDVEIIFSFSTWTFVW